MSHTTDDLVFEWFPPEETPLVVESIELPQLELIANYTGDKNKHHQDYNIRDRQLIEFVFQAPVKFCIFK